MTNPGNRRNDAHLITISDWGRLTFQETDVLAVHVNVHEAADLTALVVKSIVKARKIGLQRCENLTDRPGLKCQFRSPAGKRTEGVGMRTFTAIS